MAALLTSAPDHPRTFTLFSTGFSLPACANPSQEMFSSRYSRRNNQARARARRPGPSSWTPYWNRATSGGARGARYAHAKPAPLQHPVCIPTLSEMHRTSRDPASIGLARGCNIEPPWSEVPSIKSFGSAPGYSLAVRRQAAPCVCLPKFVAEGCSVWWASVDRDVRIGGGGEGHGVDGAAGRLAGGQGLVGRREELRVAGLASGVGLGRGCRG